jgi:zinc protease
MSLRLRLRAFLVLSVLAAATAATLAQQRPLSEKIPLDARITTGTFPNGLKYYIRANPKPDKRAELRLVVNAGSILEADDQRGLAHFVEHMAFNGTKNFPKQALVQFLESLGMRFGADVNASTSFDETIFTLQVPSDKPDVLDKSLLILEDWAHNVSFDDAEIDKERGVVEEEWRLGRGAAARLQDKQFPVILKGSRYADRLPIGTMDVVREFRHDRLKSFYADWYRPDLMAVVAVGDFDADAVKALMTKHFAAIPAAKSPKARTVYPVPAQPGTLFTIATDKEMPSTSVEVYVKSPAVDQTTIGAYRTNIVSGLFSGMLSARFAEMAQKPDAPFMGAGTGRGQMVRSEMITSLSAIVKEDGVEKGLQALFAETARVAQFGFTATELDRQRQNILRSLERAVTEKDKQESGGLADEYVRNFIEGEPSPGIVYEQALYQRFLPEITLAEINALAKNWVPDSNRVVVVSGPDKPGLTLPSEEKLKAAMTTAAAPLTAYVDKVDTTPLFDATPTPGAVVKTSTRDAIGITEWELSNGVKVVIKPTTFKEDEIVFRGTSLGGVSLASDADFVPASSAAGVISAGGLGKLSSLDLRKSLTGKIASASANISDIDQTISGGASKKDLETMFQLIYLRFTAPRADPVIFSTILSQTRSMLANQSAQPEYAYYTTLTSILTQNHLRARPMTPELLEQMSLEKSLAFYKDRFSDASGFTFVFVGSIDPATLKPLVEKYIGSLPSTHRNDTWRDVGMTTPAGVVEKTVEKGLEPKSQTTIVFSGTFPYNQEQRVAIRAMANVLENRLRETLREDLGGTYSINASPQMTRFPRPEYSFGISFGSDPKRAEALTKTVFAEIEKLKAGGPTEKEIADTKETFLRDFDANMKQNAYWLGQIALKYEYGEDPATLLAVPDFYRKIDARMIQDAARLYLDPKRYVRVSLMPEKK